MREMPYTREEDAHQELEMVLLEREESGGILKTTLDELFEFAGVDATVLVGVGTVEGC